MAKAKDLRREVVVAKFQQLLDLVAGLDGNTDAIEAKLDSIIVLLTSLDGKDYATETTLTAVLAAVDQIEPKLDSMIVLLTSLDGKDYATETTQAAILAAVDGVEALLTSLDGKDFATETTLAAIKSQTDQLEFTLGKLRTTGEDGGGGGGASGLPVIIFETNTPLAASATYDSGVISLIGKSQVETRVLSDTDGTLIFDFFSDAGGLDTLRSLSIPYVSGSGYQYFAAPAFGNYVQYRFVNSGTPQTDFHYATKCLTTALSPQIVRLDGALVEGMVGQVTRSVIAGEDPLGSLRNANVTSAGNQQVSVFDPQSGFPSIVDPNGALKIAEVIVLVGGVMDGRPLSPILWDQLSINGGSLIGGQGEQILSTGTTANGEFILQSARKARFIITQFNINHIGVQLLMADLEDPNTIFEYGSVDFLDLAGALNATPNGLFIRVTGAVPPTDPTWEIVSIKDGVETVTDSSAFNGPQASLLNKRPDLSVYETRYNAGTGLFYQGANFIHKISGLIATYAARYDFPVAARVRNINGNTTDRRLATRALGSYRLGEERGELISRGYNTTVLIKEGSGYVGIISLSRTGSGGGTGSVRVYDGIDASGDFMGRLDVGGDDVKPLTLNSTFIRGLYIVITGSGTNTATVNFEG